MLYVRLCVMQPDMRWARTAPALVSTSNRLYAIGIRACVPPFVRCRAAGWAPDLPAQGFLALLAHVVVLLVASVCAAV